MMIYVTVTAIFLPLKSKTLTKLTQSILYLHLTILFLPNVVMLLYPQNIVMITFQII